MLDILGIRQLANLKEATNIGLGVCGVYVNSSIANIKM